MNRGARKTTFSNPDLHNAIRVQRTAVHTTDRAPLTMTCTHIEDRASALTTIHRPSSGLRASITLRDSYQRWLVAASTPQHGVARVNKNSAIEDWKRPLGKSLATLLLAVGVTGLAVHGDTPAYAQVSIQSRSLDVGSMRLLTESTGWAAGENQVLWTRSYGQQWADITPAD